MSRFECTLCGACCTGAQTIFLCPDDLRLLEEFTGRRGLTALKREGLLALVRFDAGEQSFLRPILRFRQRPLRQCPFLINDLQDDGELRGLCALHPLFKPLVCSLSPLARVVELTSAPRESWSHVAPVEGCPGMGRGPEIPLKAPPALRVRLDREAMWVNHLLTRASHLQTPQSAWLEYGDIPT